MSTARSHRVRAVALLGGGMVAGVIGASAIAANAQSTTAPSTPASTNSSAPTHSPNAPMRPGNGETPVTGSKAATLKAAALKKVPGGTVDGVTTETDTPGAAYEVHVTKADGTRVKVLFDSALNYVSTETGGGPHSGPGGRGPGGPGNETTVTGTKADTLKAAALQHVPGATVERVETDSGDAAYEVHVKKADGTEVTVKFDKNLNYVAVESGHGK